MHFPVDLHIGPWSIPPHPVFEWLGCFVGARIYWMIRKKGKPIPARQSLWILVGTLLGAGIGGRLLAWLQDPVWLLHHISNPTVWTSGQTLVGALLGGLIGVEMAKKFVGWSRSTGDAFVAPLIVGICIGRVGCFLSGLPDETVGTPTRWFTGIDFGDGIRRHPTQLYEIAFLLLLGGVLWTWTHYAKRKGTFQIESLHSDVDSTAISPAPSSSSSPLTEGLLFQLFMTAYLGFRLAVEFIKPTPHIYFGLSNIQVACIFGLGYYLPKLTQHWQRQKSNAALEAKHAQ